MERQDDLSWLYVAPTSRPEAEAGDPPAPPYHGACELLIVAVEFEEEAIAASLPAGLRPAPSLAGGFSLIKVPSGWGVAPYTGSFAWIEVEGHDSSDGGRARFHAGGYTSGDCFTAWKRYYRNARIQRGEAVIDAAADGSFRGTTGSQSVTGLRMTLRPTAAEQPAFSGVNYYIHADENDALRLHSVAYTVRPTPCEVAALDILAPPGAPFGRLRVRRVRGAAHCTGSLTHSEPKQAGLRPGAMEDPQAARMVVLNVLAQLGRAAVLIGRDRRIVLANEMAQPYLRGPLAVVGGRLTAARAADQAALAGIVEAALGAEPARLSLDTTALSGGADGRPLLVQAVPVPSHSAAPAAVLLISDPARPPVGNVSDTLQLLGLTPAESRAAALAGSGLSHRQVAEKLGIAEGTVRVTMTQVYSKLNLSRASELAGLVSRLDRVALDARA